jgi:hypothetical protein
MKVCPDSTVSSLLGPNFLVSTLSSNTLRLYISPNVKDQVSHPQKKNYRRKYNFVYYEVIFIAHTSVSST